MTRTLSAGTDISSTFALIEGVESVRQRVGQRLRLHRGEWFLQAVRGVPWFDEVLRGSPGLAQAIIEDEIRQVHGVTNVSNVQVQFDRSTRRVSISADVETQFGPMQVSEDSG